MAEATVAALIDAVTPLIDACHGLARIGRAGLWNEVADGLATTVGFDATLSVHARAVDPLANAVTVGGAPWKAQPSVRIVDAATGPTYIVQKGGCCLAYTRPRDPDVTNPGRLDDKHAPTSNGSPSTPTCRATARRVRLAMRTTARRARSFRANALVDRSMLVRSTK